MKNISVALAIVISLVAFSCGDNAASDNTDNMSSKTDTTTTGLEGTRDQAGTVTGSEVVQDTSAGQSAGTEKAGVQSVKPDSGKSDSGKLNK